MSKPRRGEQEGREDQSVPPPSAATPITTSPGEQFVYATLVTLKGEVSDLSRAVGTLEKAVEKHGDRLGDLEQKVDRARTAIIVVGVILGAVGSLIAWMVNSLIDKAPAIIEQLHKVANQ